MTILHDEKILIVKDVHGTIKFLKTILTNCQYQLIDKTERCTLNYAVVNLFNTSLVLIDKAELANHENVMEAFISLSISRLFLSSGANSIERIHQNYKSYELSLQAEEVDESNSFTLVKKQQDNTIIFEGPESVTLHIREKSKDIHYGDYNVDDENSDDNSNGAGDDSDDTDDDDDDDDENDVDSDDDYNNSKTPPSLRRRRSVFERNDMQRRVEQCAYFITSIMNACEDEKKVKEKVAKKLVVPTLDTRLLCEGPQGKYYKNMPFNADPVPFETDFFKGHAILTILHPQTMDPHFRCFYPEDKKRQFEVQVQGKFKRMPRGEIYVGAEGSNKMEMGFMTKAFSNITLKFASTMVHDLHYSFGDNQDIEDYQLPHLVAPIFPTMDKIMETEEGHPLPQLNVPFKEDLDYRKKRLKWRKISQANVNLDHVYSFSVNTSNLDLPEWKFVNIPMCNPMDLCDFFGDGSLRLVAYEIPSDVCEKYKTHPQRFCNYIFNIVLTKVLPGEVVYGDSADEEDDEENNNGKEEANGKAFNGLTIRTGSNDTGCESLNYSPTPPTNDGEKALLTGGTTTTNGSLEAAAYLSDQESEEIAAYDSSKSTPSSETKKKGGGVFGAISRGLQAVKGNIASLPNVNDVSEVSGEYCIPSYDCETADSLKYCPAVIEVLDKNKRASNTMYVLPYGYTDDQSRQVVIIPRLRTYEEIAKKISMVPIPKLYKNKSMIFVEKRRRQILVSVQKYMTEQSHKNGNNKYSAWETLLKDANTADIDFLTPVNQKSFVSMLTTGRSSNVETADRASIFSDGNSRGDEESTRWEGYVCLALSNRHWIQYHMQVNSQVVKIHWQSKEILLPIRSIISARKMNHDEVPCPGYYYFCIETLRKIYYFITKTQEECDEVMETLSKLSISEERKINIQENQNDYDTFFADLIFKSKMELWKLGNKKRLYNCRRIIFTSKNIPPAKDVVESLLSKALKLVDIWKSQSMTGSTEGTNKLELAMQWIDFLNELSYLQVIDVVSLSEVERAAVFLNIYHTMVIHGSLILFLPQTSSNWHPFFNDFAYLLSFDIVSIAEVEHCILRATMTKPPRLALVGLGSASQQPKTLYPGFALNNRDFRFNFCISNGSISMPGMIFIYKSEILDTQLDDMTIYVLRNTLQVDEIKRIVYLPIVCQWFLPDFVPRGAASTPLDCLRAIALYTSFEDREKLNKLLLLGSAPHIKWKPFRHKSRHLSLLRSNDR